MKTATSGFAILVVPFLMKIGDGRFMLLNLNSNEQKSSKVLNEISNVTSFGLQAPDDKDMLGWSDKGGIYTND